MKSNTRKKLIRTYISDNCEENPTGDIIMTTLNNMEVVGKYDIEEIYSCLKDYIEKYDSE